MGGGGTALNIFKLNRGDDPKEVLNCRHSCDQYLGLDLVANPLNREAMAGSLLLRSHGCSPWSR